MAITPIIWLEATIHHMLYSKLEKKCSNFFTSFQNYERNRKERELRNTYGIANIINKHSQYFLWNHPISQIM